MTSPLMCVKSRQVDLEQGRSQDLMLRGGGDWTSEELNGPSVARSAMGEDLGRLPFPAGGPGVR